MLMPLVGFFLQPSLIIRAGANPDRSLSLNLSWLCHPISTLGDSPWSSPEARLVEPSGNRHGTIDCRLAVGKVPQRSDPGEKEVAAAFRCHEARNVFQVNVDRFVLDRELARPIVVAHDRVPVVIQKIEFRIISPVVLQELELPQQIGVECDEANSLIRTFRKLSAAPDDAVSI